MNDLRQYVHLSTWHHFDLLEILGGGGGGCHCTHIWDVTVGNHFHLRMLGADALSLSSRYPTPCVVV